MENGLTDAKDMPLSGGDGKFRKYSGPVRRALEARIQQLHAEGKDAVDMFGILHHEFRHPSGAPLTQPIVSGTYSRLRREHRLTAPAPGQPSPLGAPVSQVPSGRLPASAAGILFDSSLDDSRKVALLQLYHGA